MVHVSVAKLLEMDKMTMVGRARGKHPNLKALEKWVQENWSWIIDYMLEIMVLAQGWFVFKLKNKEDVTQIFHSHWSFVYMPILFKIWTPMFDAECEIMDDIPIWVQLPSLP